MEKGFRRTAAVHAGFFTLMEALVASAIIGIALCAILSALSMSMRESRLASDYAVASRLAQVKLDELSCSEALNEGVDGGSFGDAYPRFAWTSSVKGFSGNSVSNPVRLWQISVEVRFGESGARRSVRLDTLALMRPESSEPKGGKEAKEAR